jgi:hypothetical protein
MGYACPVCEDPQADDIHLANHLAFTALARGGDHEAWLDEHVPEWEQYDDEGLAATVTELAEEMEYPQVFEDTTGDHGHDHTHDSSHQQGGQSTRTQMDLSGMGVDSSDMLDEEAREALAEAREMTRKRREGGTEAADDSETE